MSKKNQRPNRDEDDDFEVPDFDHRREERRRQENRREAARNKREFPED